MNDTVGVVSDARGAAEEQVVSTEIRDAMIEAAIAKTLGWLSITDFADSDAQLREAVGRGFDAGFQMSAALLREADEYIGEMHDRLDAWAAWANAVFRRHESAGTVRPRRPACGRTRSRLRRR